MIRRRRAAEDLLPPSTPCRRLPSGPLRYELPIRLDGEVGVLLITVRDVRDPRLAIARYRVDPTPHPRLRRRSS